MEKMTEKIYNNQKEDEDVRKRCSEKIKNDNELYNYIMRIYIYNVFFRTVINFCGNYWKK